MFLNHTDFKLKLFLQLLPHVLQIFAALLDINLFQFPKNPYFPLNCSKNAYITKAHSEILRDTCSLIFGTAFQVLPSLVQ